MKVRRLREISVSTALIFVLACAHSDTCLQDTERPASSSIPKVIKQQSHELSTIQKGLSDSLEVKSSREIEATPIMPTYDPLEDKIVSFSMVDEDLQLVLYSLAKSVGMNLIMDPSLSEEKRLVTLNLERVSASTVLKEVLGNFDLCYEVEENVIRVKPYEERMFRLNFLDTNVQTAFEVGGDVLGAGETEQATGLSGNFKLSGQGAIKGNPYDLVQEMVQGLLTPQGKYSLNRLSGSLYIKDKPAVINSVSRLINHLRDMLAKQILIEARIIEVALSDQYAYGIDWGVVRDQSTSAARFDSVAWNLGTGLVLRRVQDNWTIDAAIDALKTFGNTKIVSNPTIRAKHGQPSMISVGTSYTYKKSVTTTTYRDSDSDTEEETEVEVSTVFDGLILGVIPFIEPDGNITLLINPIKSDVDPTSIQPEAVTATATESISLPKVGIKEISTTIGLKTGDVVILGGLIDKHEQTEEKGVPVLSSVPLLGYLFRHDAVRDETRELVIVLTASVV